MKYSIDDFKDSVKRDIHVLKRNIADLMIKKDDEKSKRAEAIKIIAVQVSILEMLLERAEKVS